MTYILGTSAFHNHKCCSLAAGLRECGDGAGESAFRERIFLVLGALCIKKNLFLDRTLRCG